MKATITITSRGVVTLPAKLRQALGLKADDQLIAETTPEGLLLRPSITLPVELYTPEREREFDETEADLATLLASKRKRRKSGQSKALDSVSLMRVFLDANVLFSAAKSDGAVRLLVRRLLDAGHACVADEYVVTEARRNLEAKGPEALVALDTLLAKLEVAKARVLRVALKDADWLPEKDRPVLYAAIRLKCEALVTGERTHFGGGYGKSFGGVTIYTPRSLAEALLY